jgi:hypothetical protein
MENDPFMDDLPLEHGGVFRSLVSLPEATSNQYLTWPLNPRPQWRQAQRRRVAPFRAGPVAVTGLVGHIGRHGPGRQLELHGSA